MKTSTSVIAAGFLTLAVVSGQIDLRTQSKNVDFSTAPSTRPFKSGTILPASCAVGQIFYKNDAAPGANIYGCVATNTWAVQGGGSGSPGSGQLDEFAVARQSATTLVIGPSCSAVTPCTARVGSTSYSYSAPATATVTGSGNGMLFIYISASGAITVGHNVGVSCVASCTAQAGITAFPMDAIPMATWTVTGGSLNQSGGVDLRAFLTTQNVIATGGLTGVAVGSSYSISVDSTLVALRAAVPGASNSTCVPGRWASDQTFYYVCVAPNTWKRIGLASW